MQCVSYAHNANCIQMHTADQAIAAWVAKGDPYRWLVIVDRGIRCLPPLPEDLLYLELKLCLQLRTLGTLPASLCILHMCDCPRLTVLLALPPALTELYCDICPRLRALPVPPPTLRHLRCLLCPAIVHATLCAAVTNLHSFDYGYDTVLPDARPPGLWRFNDYGGVTPHEYAARWRQKVRLQHVQARRRVAAALPPAALLYV
jgi:hypothetical protein